ncbi:MAG: hypothetical protein Kow0029_23740 [Candidatus Rifleibacteriota bacterium]
MAGNRKAVTLVEITLAITILIIAIIPLMRMSSSDAVTAIETEKIQIAERILESIKSELMALPFKRFYERSETEGEDKDFAGPFELSDGFYPISLTKVLEIQKKYKDFRVEGTWSYVKNKDGKIDKTMIQADISCSFSQDRHSEIRRNKSFLIVKP